MSGLREEWNRHTKQLNWVATYAVVVRVLSILVDLGPLFDAEWVAYSRAVVALVGIAGGVVLWRTPGGNTGWLVLLGWAAVQIPIYAWEPVGSPTEQFFAFPLGYTESTTVNGFVTEYTQIAVNIVGVVLLAVLLAWREPIRRGWRGRPTTVSQR